MFPGEEFLRFLIAAFFLLATWSDAFAERATFTFLKTVTISELNDILSTERDGFLGNRSRIPAAETASNDVDLYAVRYLSHRPDLRSSRKTWVSGLLALPKGSDHQTLRLLSYQHGTVLGRDHVPSYAFRNLNENQYNSSYETRYMVALYAGNGFAVMAADYFGLGDSQSSNEAYMMRRSTAQANYDLYFDVRRYLTARNIDVSKFFLGGWSQGGLNTPGFLALLESRGVTVNAAFTAASPNDPFAALNAVFYHKRALDADWINAVIALTIFSCENYMGPAGLAKATIHPDYYQFFKSIYDRTDFKKGADTRQTPADKPEFLDYLRPAFKDPSYFANSAYGKCLAVNETYRQEFKTPMRMYYGSQDEVIREKVALLAHDYQEALVNTPDSESTNKIIPFLVDGGPNPLINIAADHRMTFIAAAAHARPWLTTMP